jgi:hypothetical protein
MANSPSGSRAALAEDGGRGAGRRPFLGRLPRGLGPRRPGPRRGGCPGGAGPVAPDARAGGADGKLPAACGAAAGRSGADVRAGQAAWVDVTAPGDGCAFALCDPVAVSGVAGPGKRWPLVLSAAFTKTLSEDAWRALRWRFFERHFQYLNAFDNSGRPAAYDFFAVTAGPRTLGDALCGPQALGQPDREGGQRLHGSRGMTAPGRDLPPKPARGPSCLALALHAAVPARHPLGPARAALSRVDGRVPDAVLPVLPREPARSCRRNSEGAADGFPEIRPGGRGAAPASGRVGLPDQWRDLGAAAADHRPGLRGRAAARHVSGDAGGRRGGGGAAGGGGTGHRTGDEPCRGGRDLPHAFLHPDRGRRSRRRSIASSAPISAASRS